MLDSSGDTDCEVYLRTNSFTCLTNLQILRFPARIHNRTGAAHRTADSVCQVLQQFEVFRAAYAAAAGLVVLAALTARVQKQRGLWTAGTKVRLLPAECDYRLLYLTYALSFAAILLAVLVVTTTYYSMGVLGVALFAFAVYYTTKLM